MKRARLLFVFLFLGMLIFILSRCFQAERTSNDPRGNDYISSTECKQCHQSIFNTYSKTFHSLASEEASKKNILGSFKPDSNTLVINQDTKVVTEQRDSGLYQIVYFKGKEKEAHRFDISMGGKAGQTFLYWQGKKTYQLPLSYLTSIHQWVMSPGFSAKEVKFTRFIGQDCYECHSSYIKSDISSSLVDRTEELEKESLVMGIDCQRCHGPGLKHVNYHLQNPEKKESKYIVKIQELSQQPKLDLCAQCHSGNNKIKLISRFHFKPGHTLDKFFLNDGYPGANSSAELDVHGNQYELLASSKCFMVSKKLDCNSCHDPHTNAEKDMDFYTAKCISCHQDIKHSFTTNSLSIKNKCVECHMPSRPSKAITFEIPESDKKIYYNLRTHKIAVYPEETQKVLAYLQKVANKTSTSSN